MKTALNFAGIYEIVHVASGKRYVGNSKNISSRFYAHRYDLKRNQHFCRHLQNAWNKYGEDAFEFRLIERCFDEVAVLLAREQFWIDKHSKRLYNSRKFSEQFIQDWYRTDASLETRKKASVRMKAYRANLKRCLVCAQCDEPFVTNNPSPDVRFCSAKCRGRFAHVNKRYTQPETCKVCGKEFRGKKGNTGRSIVCSRACAFESMRCVNQEQLVDILTRAVHGETIVAIADRYGIKTSSVKKMIHRETHASVELPDWLSAELESRNEKNRKTRAGWMSDEEFLEIKLGLAAGETKASLAKRFTTTVGQVASILYGKRGGHVEVPDELKAAFAERQKAKPYKLDVDQIRDIKIRLQNGESRNAIAEIHGVTPSLITQISLGRLKLASTVTID